MLQRLLYVGLCFKGMIETYINSEKKSESPMGFEPMTFRVNVSFNYSFKTKNVYMYICISVYLYLCVYVYKYIWLDFPKGAR